MVTVTRELAERIADVAEVLLSGDGSDAPLEQLASLALDLIPGSSAAGIVAINDNSWNYAASAPGVADLHNLQLLTGNGPVAETLRYGEARRIDDTDAEDRWPDFCAAMAGEALRSCIVLPLRTDRQSGGALAVYGRERNAFAGSGHDLALLFAAQGGVAMRNAAMYRNCHSLVQNLRVALESRAVIEQAKGIIVAEYGVSPEVAFKRLSVLSQNTNTKLRDIAVGLVEGRINRVQLGADDG